MPTAKASLACLVLSILALLSSTAAASEKLVIVGSTVIDVSDFGNGESDIVDSVVVIEDGVITAIGSRTDVGIPADARVLMAEGMFMVPGLTDGFAALNNQSYADAYLECGVTSIIAVSGGRRGPLARDLELSPHVSRLESVGDDPGTLEEHLVRPRRTCS